MRQHSAFYGPQDQAAFFTEMIARRRLVIRLSLDRVNGVIATGGRRPLPAAGRCPPPGVRRGYPGGQMQTERGEQLGLRAVALGGHLALDGAAGRGQQRDAGAPVTAVEAAGDEPGSFEAVEQQGQRRLVRAERPNSPPWFRRGPGAVSGRAARPESARQ
jgi:hypothetical protein